MSNRQGGISGQAVRETAELVLEVQRTYVTWAAHCRQCQSCKNYEGLFADNQFKVSELYQRAEELSCEEGKGLIFQNLTSVSALQEAWKSNKPGLRYGQRGLGVVR